MMTITIGRLSRMLTHERLKEVISYDPQSGIIMRNGKIVGSNNGHGYLRIMIDGVRYFANKLIWFYMTGEYPQFIVDHKNGIRSDNAWSNLRKAGTDENAWNRGIASNNSSGFKGVYWRSARSKWVAEICVNGKSRKLGSFKCPTAAHIAYSKAAKKYHGDFARVA